MKYILFISIYLLTTLQCWCVPNKSIDDSIKVLNNSAVDYFYAGDYGKSESLFYQTLSVALSGYPEDHVEIADACNNIGVILIRKWQYNLALEFLNKARIIYEKNNNVTATANAYSNIGKVYKLKGDYSHAINYYNKTLDYLEGDYTSEAIQRRVEVLIRVALLEMERDNYEKAISLIRNALNQYSFSNEKLEITNQDLYSAISEAYSLAGNSDSCLYYFQLSLESVNTKNEFFDYLKATSHQELVDHFLRNKNFDKAFETIQLTEQFFNNSSVDSLFYLKVLTQYAAYYRLKMDYPQAINYYNKAHSIVLNKNTSEINDLYSSNIKGISLLENRANCFIEWFKTDNEHTHLARAHKDLQLATKLIDQSRNSYLSIESKLYIAKNQSKVYTMGLYCSEILYKKTKLVDYLESAFYFSEKGKSSVLLDAINEEKAKEFAGIPGDLINLEKELIREISFYKEMLYQEGLKNNPDSIKLKNFGNNLFKFVSDYEELKERLEKQYPDYYAFKYNSKTVGISTIQKELSRDETLIEYALSDSALYTFVINSNNAILYKKPINKAFKIEIENYLNQYRTFDFNRQGKNIFTSYELNANSVYTSILSFIPKEHLKTKMIIVPDGILSYIPFEGLACTLHSESLTSFSDIDYLLLQHPISYSYSATLYAETNRNQRRKILNRVLAVAPTYSYNPEYPTSQNNTSEYSLRDNLVPLPYAQDEVKMISTITRGHMSLGKEATEPYFINESEKYDILHLAMHTLIDDKNPLYSRLVFYDENYSDENGLLNTNEIFSLNLNAKLTVLSACSSGDGEYSKGEGVMSLSRGFFYAGCPSLVMTLWKVEDESALKLMKFFYTSLLKGKSKAEALNMAKIKYLNSSTEQSKHPFFWASYILIGNTSPIYISKAAKLLVITILLVITFAIYIRSKRKPKLPEPNPTSNQDLS